MSTPETHAAEKDDKVRPAARPDRGAHFWRLPRAILRGIYEKLFKLRKASEDDRRKEFLLNIILGMLIVLAGWSTVVVLIADLSGSAASHIPFAAAALMLAFLAFLLGLSRRGHIAAPSYLLIALLLLGTLYSNYRWGAGLPAALLGYALVITISSILIGSRLSIAATVVAAVTILLVGGYEGRYGAIPEWKRMPTTFPDAVEYSIFLSIITTLSWLSDREIRKSLGRARASEKALEVERSSLEVKVVERTEELRQAQAEKVAELYRFAEFGRLSSGIFHDLVNPLTAVTGNMSRLEDSIHSDIPHIKKHLNQAVAASKRMESFIATVKKQIRRDEFKERFSLNEEIEETLTLFRYKALKAGVMLEFHAEAAIETYANPLKFQQVAANLVSNAIDAYDGMPEGTDRRVIVGLERIGETARLSARDFGCGIDPAVASKIFDPFFTTKSQHRGMGLGLSTTKRIVEGDLSGTIAVESVPGHGALFTVAFPLIRHEPNNQGKEDDRDG